MIKAPFPIEALEIAVRPQGLRVHAARAGRWRRPRAGRWRRRVGGRRRRRGWRRVGGRRRRRGWRWVGRRRRWRRRRRRHRRRRRRRRCRWRFISPQRCSGWRGRQGHQGRWRWHGAKGRACVNALLIKAPFPIEALEIAVRPQGLRVHAARAGRWRRPRAGRWRRRVGGRRRRRGWRRVGGRRRRRGWRWVGRRRRWRRRRRRHRRRRRRRRCRWRFISPQRCSGWRGRQGHQGRWRWHGAKGRACVNALLIKAPFPIEALEPAVRPHGLRVHAARAGR